MERTADCVIVGGGIGGTVLALALARRGFRLVICEREASPPPAARPEVLAASTIQAFRALGLEDAALRTAALPLRGLELRQRGGSTVLAIAAEELARAGVQPYSADPGRMRQLLLDAALAQASVRVERGLEVRSLLREGGRVVGVEGARDGQPVTIQAPLIIGDDGSQSRVRGAIGAPIQLTEFPLVFLGATSPALPGLPDAAAQAWFNPWAVRAGLMAGLFLPLPGARTAFVFVLSAKAAERFKRATPANFYRAAEALAPPARALPQYCPFPDGFTLFRRAFGHAGRYVSDGAALLGDAAHPVTPAGGQGANMSVADALALAPVAEEALRARDCSAARLAAYEALRRPANERSLQFSVGANQVFRVLRVAPWLGIVLLAFLRRVDRRPDAKDQFLQAVAQAFRTPAP